MMHVFIGEILANMTQVSDVAPGPLVSFPATFQVQSELFQDESHHDTICTNHTTEHLLEACDPLFDSNSHEKFSAYNCFSLDLSISNS
jgi:hypothetical protein